MVNINIRFKKKDLFLVLAIGIFVIGIGVVIAFNNNYPAGSANPAVMGHTADEIKGLMGDCRIDSLDSGSDVGTLNCPVNYTLISGGCEIYTSSNSEDLVRSKPLNNGWACASSNSNRYVRVFTYCCKGAVVAIGGSSSGSFGAWTDKDSVGNTLVGNIGFASANQYQATGDGFLVARLINAEFPSTKCYIKLGGVGNFIEIYDSRQNSGGRPDQSFSIPIGKDDIFYLTNDRTDSGTYWQIYWKPMGSSELVKQS